MALFIPALFAGARKIFAVVYDGVGDYLKHTGGPTGAADGADLTLVWAGTFNSDGSTMMLVDIPGTVPVQLIRQSDNTIDFIGGTAGAVFSNSTAAVAAALGFLIVIAHCSGTSSTLTVIHAAGTITGTNTPGAASDLDLTADWYFGSDGGATSFLDADTAIWWADNTVVSTTEQFWDSTNDTLRDPGSDGSNPLDGDHAPLVCHVNPAATHTVNRGSGGDADVGTTFEDGTSPGAYSPDFTPDDATIAFVSGSNQSSNAIDVASYTFNAVPIGTPAADRIVALQVITETVALSDVTIDGNSMTPAVQAANGNARSEIWYLPYPTGSTANIVVTLTSASGNSCGISAYEINGATSTPTDTDTATGSGSALSLSALTVPSGGVALCSRMSNNIGATFDWTNATETVDQEVPFRSSFTAAITDVAGLNTITATITGTTGASSMAGAAWGP